MHGKLRPVGSRVPLPSSVAVSMPWDSAYEAEYCASGTDALAMAIGLAILARPGVEKPEVIIPAYGCPDLVAAIVSQGAEPVLVDLVPETPFMDLHQLSEAVTDRTVAVVGVGLLGIPERLEELAEICNDHSLALIEDSAQCFPPHSTRQRVADFVVLSFGRGKPINLMGGGAMLHRGSLTGEQQRYLEGLPKEKIQTGFLWRVKRVLFNLLMSRIGYLLLERVPGLGLGKTRFEPHGVVTRREIPAGLLSAGLKHQSVRSSPHVLYEQELQCLERAGWVLLGRERFRTAGMSAENPRLRFAVLTPDGATRDEVVRELNAAGVGSNGLYEVALPGVDGIPLSKPQHEFPVAADFAARLLTLPCHEDVTGADVRRIAGILRAVGDLSPG